MLSKSIVNNALLQMPEEFTIDELFEEMVFIQKVKKGLEDSKNNNVVGFDEIKKITTSWFE